MPRKGVKGLDITSLPYRIKIYSNGQVLIPARLVRSLGIEHLKYANITLKVKGEKIISIKKAKLLRTKHTSSRQFTLPKSIRLKYKLLPEEEIEVLNIVPAK
ncbi:MAG: AbrB/MazE/SpoVT family DNA-binding domain-containing protein [Thermoprotei archaeon]|nr:MAG: AbrB/MazE/SpoVT family DNA-binding domain-containing protein [Thermoprotei archaeon]